MMYAGATPISTIIFVSANFALNELTVLSIRLDYVPFDIWAVYELSGFCSASVQDFNRKLERGLSLILVDSISTFVPVVYSFLKLEPPFNGFLSFFRQSFTPKKRD